MAERHRLGKREKIPVWKTNSPDTLFSAPKEYPWYTVPSSNSRVASRSSATTVPSALIGRAVTGGKGAAAAFGFPLVNAAIFLLLRPARRYRGADRRAIRVRGEGKDEIRGAG